MKRIILTIITLLCINSSANIIFAEHCFDSNKSNIQLSNKVSLNREVYYINIANNLENENYYSFNVRFEKNNKKSIYNFEYIDGEFFYLEGKPSTWGKNRINKSSRIEDKNDIYFKTFEEMKYRLNSYKVILNKLSKEEIKLIDNLYNSVSSDYLIIKTYPILDLLSAKDLNIYSNSIEINKDIIKREIITDKGYRILETVYKN